MLSSHFAHVPLCSLPNKARYGNLRQGVPWCLMGDGCCSFASTSSKKSSVPDHPTDRCTSSEKKATFAVRAKKPSAVNVCASGSFLQIAAIAAGERDFAPSLLATTPLLGLRSPLLLAAPSIVAELCIGPAAAMLLSSRAVICFAFSSRLNSLGDAAYASSPVVDALTIRDKKIRRLWLQGERAKQKIQCRPAHGHRLQLALNISGVMLPLKASRPPKSLALPRISPERTSAASCLCSTYRRTFGANLQSVEILVVPILCHRGVG